MVCSKEADFNHSFLSSIFLCFSVSEVTPEMIEKWKHKTELCSYFTNGKKCLKGKKCPYAHGDKELRPKRRDKICTNFKAGICFNSDEACNFAHGPQYLGTFMPGQTDRFPETKQQLISPVTVPLSNLKPAPVPQQTCWKVTSSSTLKSESDKEKANVFSKCGICQQVMNICGNLEKFTCGHHYHTVCFDQLNIPRSNCPKCKGKSIDIDDFPTLG